MLDYNGIDSLSLIEDDLDYNGIDSLSLIEDDLDYNGIDSLSLIEDDSELEENEELLSEAPIPNDFDEIESIDDFLA